MFHENRFFSYISPILSLSGMLPAEDSVVTANRAADPGARSWYLRRNTSLVIQLPAFPRGHSHRVKRTCFRMPT